IPLHEAPPAMYSFPPIAAAEPAACSMSIGANVIHVSVVGSYASNVLVEPQPAAPVLPPAAYSFPLSAASETPYNAVGMEAFVVHELLTGSYTCSAFDGSLSSACVKPPTT